MAIITWSIGKCWNIFLKVGIFQAIFQVSKGLTTATPLRRQDRTHPPETGEAGGAVAAWCRNLEIAGVKGSSPRTWCQNPRKGELKHQIVRFHGEKIEGIHEFHQEIAGIFMGYIPSLEFGWDHWDMHSMYHTGIVMRYTELHTMNERTTVGRFWRGRSKRQILTINHSQKCDREKWGLATTNEYCKDDQQLWSS